MKQLEEMTIEELEEAHLDGVLDARENFLFDGNDRPSWDYVAKVGAELARRRAANATI